MIFQMSNKAELTTVIHNFLTSFNSQNRLPVHKLRVLDALQKCRTEYMGGHIQSCESCGETRTAFNSCRNRHCPKCGAIDKEKWIINREADLLPVRYFHVIFTVPDKLNGLFMHNQRQMYNLLFTVTWDVLHDFGKTKRWAGGRLGATAILHTWGQKMNYHPHLHLIIPAGVLMPDNKWKHSRSKGKYLFSVKQMSSVFRARFVEQLRCLIKNKEIEGLVPDGLFEKDWVVYAKRPFGGPRQVINYLGRYTHRTAISNDRILNVTDNEVTFSWKDYSNNYARKNITLKGEDFLRLFCQHILPPGFTRIRHYGFLSSASKTKSLAIIRKALKVASPVKLSTEEKKQKALDRMGVNPGRCRICGGNMIIIETIPNMFRTSSRAPPCKNQKTITQYNRAI
jgi:predicted Zn-ribbon and HTH transcriptional regulator